MISRELFSITLLSLTVIQSISCECTFHKYTDNVQIKGETQIELLKGKRFGVEDAEYEYEIGICVDADDTGSTKDVGILQKNKKTKDSGTTIIGKITKSDIMAGENWALLEYSDGKTYGSHCSHENRKGRIMFTCDPDVDGYETPEVVTIIAEENNKTEDCFYLFEITTSEVCEKKPFITVGLSVGSVLLIVLVSVIGVYLLAGFLYNRFVLGAKGCEQFPNHSFWQDFGNLQADGCDLVCRAWKSRQPKSYKGIGDDQLQEQEDPTDEHLLPM